MAKGWPLSAARGQPKRHNLSKFLILEQLYGLLATYLSSAVVCFPVLPSYRLKEFGWLSL